MIDYSHGMPCAVKESKEGEITVKEIASYCFLLDSLRAKRMREGIKKVHVVESRARDTKLGDD